MMHLNTNWRGAGWDEFITAYRQRKSEICTGFVFGWFEDNPKNTALGYQYRFKANQIEANPLQAIWNLYTSGGWRSAQILFVVSHDCDNEQVTVLDRADGYQYLNLFKVWCVERCIEFAGRRDPHYQDDAVIHKYFKTEDPQLLKELQNRLSVSEHNLRRAQDVKAPGFTILAREWHILNFVCAAWRISQEAAWRAGKLGLHLGAFSESEANDYLLGLHGHE